MANYFNTLNLREQLDQLGRCRFMDREEFATEADYLKGKKVVIVGCGAQGLNQGLNMRDSGLDVAYALRQAAIDEQRQSYKNAFEIISEIPLSIIAPIGNNHFISEINKETTNWKSLPFILPESGTARNRANQWLKDQKIKPTIYAQVSGHEAIVSMVALGCGIGIAPDVVINNSPVKDKVQRLNISPIAPFKLGLCCKKSKLNDSVIQALWQVAENTFI